MEISRETDYAIRCVLYLSQKWGQVTIINDIACDMAIPKAFLAKIVQKLARAKIIRSFRGVRGGFQLARKPEEISLLDVIEAIQGPVAMNTCAVDTSHCGFSAACVVHPVWVELRKRTQEYLRGCTFAHLQAVGPLPQHGTRESSV